ncbi:MAG TPA: hypothetical protein VGI52_03890 [Solirubrobacteraceae bacterium]|jgi:hypothetical protein
MRGSTATQSALALALVSGLTGIGGLGGGVGVAAAAPLDISAPSISGTPIEGQRLKASKGVFLGEKPIAYAYGWLRCDDEGSNCEAISPPSGAARRVVHEDLGRTLRVTVTASDPSGHASATSDPTGPVAAAALRKGKAPKVSGTARDGQVLTVGNGSWKGTAPESFGYQWQACPRTGACVSIPGAEAASYRVVSQEIGSRLRVIVTATNGAGSLDQSSKRSAKVLPGTPVNTAAPSISGGPQEGQTLAADPGAWVGTGPLAFAYQWLRCSIVGGSCNEIAGATQPTYTLSTLDLASNLAVVVTASNAQGAVPAASPETQPIFGIPPTNSVLPSISGLVQDGQLLSVVAGSWSGTEPIGYSYQWQVCNALGLACENLTGATDPSLALDPSEIGKTLDLLVTATNAAGSTTLTSSLSGLIAGILPKNVTLPSVTGTLKNGGLLSLATGTWSGSAPIAYSYQWQLCVLGTCTDIAKATSSTRSLGVLDIGDTVRVLVTATNAAGATAVTSAVTGLIGL